MAHLRIVLTACALLVAMVLSGAIGTRQRVGSVVLALLSFVWLTLDRDFEGGALIKLSADHSLVTADLVGIAGFAVAGWQWWRGRN